MKKGAPETHILDYPLVQAWLIPWFVSSLASSVFCQSLSVFKGETMGVENDWRAKLTE